MAALALSKVPAPPAFDSTTATAGAATALEDVRTAALEVERLNGVVQKLQQQEDAVLKRRNTAEIARFNVAVDDTLRQLVLANAAYDKATYVAAVMDTIAKLQRQVESEARAGNNTKAAQVRQQAENLAKYLQTMKVPVKLPPKDQQVEELKGLLGALDRAGLNGLADGALGKSIFDKIGKKLNLKKMGKKIEQAAKFAQKNAAAIGAAVGTVVTFIPPAGPIIGPAIIAAGALIQKTAPKPKPPKPAGPKDLGLVDPRTKKEFTKDAQGNWVLPEGLTIDGPDDKGKYKVAVAQSAAEAKAAQLKVAGAAAPGFNAASAAGGGVIQDFTGGVQALIAGQPLTPGQKQTLIVAGLGIAAIVGTMVFLPKDIERARGFGPPPYYPPAPPGAPR